MTFFSLEISSISAPALRTLKTVDRTRCISKLFSKECGPQEVQCGPEHWMSLTPLVYSIKQEFFSAEMLPVMIFISILWKHCNKIPSLRKNQNKIMDQTICKSEFRENICLKITRPDGLLLNYGEWRWRSHCRFCRYAGNKTNSADKELNTTNINRKGAAPNRKIGLPQNSLLQ